MTSSPHSADETGDGGVGRAIDVLGGEPTTVGPMVVLLATGSGRHLIDEL